MLPLALGSVSTFYRTNPVQDAGCKVLPSMRYIALHFCQGFRENVFLEKD